MAKVIMKGAELAAAMKEKLVREVEDLKARGIEPTMDIVRVGAKPEDLAYERGEPRHKIPYNLHELFP